jgi:hypothetical protein
MNKTKDDGGSITASMMTTVGPMDAIGGLSIRDWFAGMALQGILANPETAQGIRNRTCEEGKKALMISAFNIADAMLAARKGDA